MGGEQFVHDRGDAEGLDALGQFTGHHAAEACQGVDHRLAPSHQLGGSAIGSELAVSGEFCNDNGRTESEEDLNVCSSKRMA